MDSHNRKEKPSSTATVAAMTAATTSTDLPKMETKKTCKDPSCFFCLMNQANSKTRREGIKNFLKYLPLIDGQELVMAVSGIWNVAMANPDDQELPSLGVFKCMASLIQKGINNKDWLSRNQNIYIPYYAAHIIGSYSMNRVESAEKAIDSGVIPPLLELMRGSMSWVEQRVAVRALGHLASYKRTFESVAKHETEVVNLAMGLASRCLETVYANFVGARDGSKRLRYHSDLLTRGVGGMEVEDRKAEEWASQLQYWSLHLLNCFAIKERCLDLVCDSNFLRALCGMWGGLVNQTSPGGFGLIRILCYSEIGRAKITEAEVVIESLCNLSRSSDNWQYMGIDCLLLLLKDINTRKRVLAIAASSLADLIEVQTLRGRSNLGEKITRTLITDFRKMNPKAKNLKTQLALQEVWNLKVERRERERKLSEQRVEERRVLINLIKQQGNHSFGLEKIEEAILGYTEALDLCPLRLRKERVVLFSNRAQCYLLLGDADAAISDATRALSISSPVNSHAKSLWRRSQAYDMKGLAKESLMDCAMFVKFWEKNHVGVPPYADRMIKKQMNAVWLFADARLKAMHKHDEEGKMEVEKGVGNSSAGPNDEEPYEFKGGRRKPSRFARSM